MDGQASRSPQLGEVVNRAVARGQAEVRVSEPCVVLSYDANNQTVSLQPQIADAFLDDDGVLQFKVLPVVNGVPVHFPSGGGLRITFPIQAGDTGMLVVCDRSIDAWKSYGGKQQPDDARRHHLSDAWFEGGVNPNGKWKNASSSKISIGDDTSQPLAPARVTDPIQVSEAWMTWLQGVGTFIGTPIPSLADPTLDFGSIGSIAVPPVPCGSSTIETRG